MKMQAQQDFDLIEKLLRIIETESCLLIYAYLMIFGRSTPAKLRDVTGLSKATMFRNLALLLDTGIVAKEDLEVADMRYSLHYYISKNILEETKRLYSERVRKFALQSGNENTIDRFVLGLETLPLTLNRFTTQLILNVNKNQTDSDESKCRILTKMIAFRVGDIADVSIIIDKIQELVELFDAHISAKHRNLKKPLANPTTLSISLLALGDELPYYSDAVVAKSGEC